MRYTDITPKDLREETSQYLPKDQVKKITAAIELAETLHANQIGLGNKPFTQHLLNTAHILANLKLDMETVSSGILHDILDNSKEWEGLIKKVRTTLGKDAADIVRQVGKIDEIERKNRGRISNKLLGKVVLGTAKDVRVIFIQLAAMLENLRHINYIPESQHAEIAKIVQEIHVPIAHKLGLYDIEWELNDLAFKITNPKIYKQIKNQLKEKRHEREKKLVLFQAALENVLEKTSTTVTLNCRPKSFSGIYRKMRTKNKKINEIHDLLGARIITQTMEDCYKVLGILHASFKQVGHFDDYIAMPKPNQYRSIHTVIEYQGNSIEVQIRTWQMHRIAEEGLAAHWQYKKFDEDPLFDKKLTWAKQLVEFQRQHKPSGLLGSLMTSLSIDFGSRDIFVLSPTYEVVSLPDRSTPVDFAFSIHTELGYKCERALVNNKIVPLNSILENGDLVKIVKGKRSRVKRQWLLFAQSKKAREKIRQKLGLQLSPKRKKAQIKVKTTADRNTQLAKCCNPLIGDKIIGLKTTKRKIVIHRIGCHNIQKVAINKLIEIDWAGKGRKKFETQIKIVAADRTAILLDLLSAMGSVYIKSTEAKQEPKNYVSCTFTLEIPNSNTLDTILSRLRAVPGVEKVNRI